MKHLVIIIIKYYQTYVLTFTQKHKIARNPESFFRESILALEYTKRVLAQFRKLPEAGLNIK